MSQFHYYINVSTYYVVISKWFRIKNKSNEQIQHSLHEVTVMQHRSFGAIKPTF